jgi:thermostable 8-oxoguanine DNA glycosylase
MDRINFEEPRMVRLLKQMSYNFNVNYTTKLKREITDKRIKGEPIDLTDIMRIFLWKLDRIIDEDIDSDFIEALNTFINQETIDINAPETKEFLIRFNSLKGFHMPSISAVLKFLRPDRFAIIDKRCYRIWKGKNPPYKYSVDTYIEYLNYLHETASNIGISIGELEEKMYEMDKIINGTLDRNQTTLKSIYPDIEEKLVVSHDLKAGDTCLLCKDSELVEIDKYTFHDILHRKCKVRTVSRTIANSPTPDWIAICPVCDQYALGIEDNLEILLRDKTNRMYPTLMDYQKNR